MLSNLLKPDNFIINLAHHLYKSFYLFWDLLHNLLDDSYFKQPYFEKWNLCQMFNSWWDFGEVCAFCAKSARSCCLALKLLKSSLYVVLNEKFQYGDLEALGCLPYPVMRPSVWSRGHLKKIMSNMVILKLWGVCHTRFLCQNQVLIVCMTQDQLFHTYDIKVFTDNHMSWIKYNYYISNVSKDYDDSQRNGTTEDSITPQER
jgi:hypothetical protein